MTLDWHRAFKLHIWGLWCILCELCQMVLCIKGFCVLEFIYNRPVPVPSKYSFPSEWKAFNSYWCQKGRLTPLGSSSGCCQTMASEPATLFTPLPLFPSPFKGVIAVSWTRRAACCEGGFITQPRNLWLSCCPERSTPGRGKSTDVLGLGVDTSSPAFPILSK